MMRWTVNLSAMRFDRFVIHFPTLSKGVARSEGGMVAMSLFDLSNDLASPHYS